MLTDPSVTEIQRGERIRDLRAQYLTGLRTTRKSRLPHDEDDLDAEPAAERSWKEQLLEQLMRIAPDAFERLARRLLREADFDSVNVTGRSATAGSTDLASTGSGSSASLCSSSASATGAA